MSPTLFKEYSEKYGAERVVFISQRAEITFGKYLSGLNLEVIPQFKVMDYRIDFYIPLIDLAIEFDEDYHNRASQKVKDCKRQSIIENKLGCTFIRVSENNPGQGIYEIYDFVNKHKLNNK